MNNRKQYKRASNTCCPTMGELEHTNIQLNDGAYTIFLTPLGTTDDVSPELKAFFDFVAGKSSDDPFIKKLAQRIFGS